MKQIWKWVMYLNAKVFCFAATLLFFCTVGYCMYLYMKPLEPIKDGSGSKPPDAPTPQDIPIRDYVDRQRDGDDLTIPIDPFRPTMEAILMSPDELAKLLAGVGANGSRFPGGPGGPRVNPGAGQSANTKSTGADAPGGPKMVTPKITFGGFMKRTDGSMVAYFTDSTDRSKFYTAGDIVHGLEILGTDMKEATVKFPDGSVGKMPVGGSVDLAPELDPNPPPPDAKN